MKLSIITVNYNDAEGLERTIKSVVSQTFKDYEYIVIDGGSSDGSKDVLLEYDPYISYWVSEKDDGIYHAMNKGVAHAIGSYCIFMNSGDCFYSRDVLERVAALDIKDDIIVGDVVSNIDGKVIPTKSNRELSLYHLFSASIPHQASFIRTVLLKKYPYDETLRIASDWKFFLQTIIFENCSFKYVDEIVAEYDMDGISSHNPEEMFLEKEKVLSVMIPHRILLDYKMMKSSECLTQKLTPQLRKCYRIDKLLYYIGVFLIRIFGK